jgi:Nif-specific regulatory protein
VLPIRVPALAERRDDVPELVQHFVAQVCERHGFPRMQLTRGAIRAAQSAEWPGNVRQLAHAIEAAVIRAAGERASAVDVRHLFPDRADSQPPGPERTTFQEATRQFQATLLRDALNDTGWNITEVARRLDLTRSHVYNLMHAFGIARTA